jgi:hypothetical protein
MAASDLAFGFKVIYLAGLQAKGRDQRSALCSLPFGQEKSLAYIGDEIGRQAVCH